MDFLANLEYEPGEPFVINSDYIPGVMNLPLDCTDSIAPYLPASKASSIAAVTLACLSTKDTLCDLGCGNGKVLQTAMEMIGPELNCIGVELDKILFEFVKTTFPSIKVIHSNMFTINLKELNVSVFILYLLPAGLEKLKPKLSEWFFDFNNCMNRSKLECNIPKKRVVTIGYAIKGWSPKSGVQVDQSTDRKDVFTGGEDLGVQSIYYYDIESLARE